MRNIRDTTDLQSPIEVKVEWSRISSDPPLALSISALMLSKEDIVDQLDDFVFYGSPVNRESDNIISKDHSITCDVLDFKKGFGTEGMYQMKLELDKIREDINHVRILVSINHKDESHNGKSSFDTLRKATFTIKDKNGATYSTNLSKDADMNCRCIEVGLVKRYGSSWRFEDELNCLLGGLDMAYDDYVKDDIVKRSPFNQIGNITRIEQRYRELCTTIGKDGSKTISERSSEFIATVVDKEIGSNEKQQKPWEKVRNSAEPKGESVLNVVSLAKTKKPWKGKTASRYKGAMASIPFSAPNSPIQPVEPKVETSRKGKFPRVKNNKGSHSVSLKMRITKNDDASTMISTRKFPKVKKH